MPGSYVPIFRRRREGKTDYRKRKLIVIAKRPFITVHISGKNIQTQISRAEPQGDKVIASAHSRELLEYGWKGSRKSLPAAYLTGFLLGLRALKKGVKEAILYTGVRRYIRGSRITAVVKGLLDSGVDVPVDKETLPSDERITGGHISAYASLLMDKDRNLYKARFSKLIERGLDPKDYPSHFQEVLKEIKGRSR
ncbi:MAG: 50S ribosomal protein L18 [Nitrososphaerota archaeon]